MKCYFEHCKVHMWTPRVSWSEYGEEYYCVGCDLIMYFSWFEDTCFGIKYYCLRAKNLDSGNSRNSGKV